MNFIEISDYVDNSQSFGGSELVYPSKSLHQKKSTLSSFSNRLQVNRITLRAKINQDENNLPKASCRTTGPALNPYSTLLNPNEARRTDSGLSPEDATASQKLKFFFSPSPSSHQSSREPKKSPVLINSLVKVKLLKLKQPGVEEESKHHTQQKTSLREISKASIPKFRLDSHTEEQYSPAVDLEVNDRSSMKDIGPIRVDTNQDLEEILQQNEQYMNFLSLRVQATSSTAKQTY